MALDYVRTRLQNVMSNLVDERLSPPVVKAIVVRSARGPSASRVDGVSDVAALRAMFSANGLIALFDTPWVAIYVMVIWMFHPYLGIGAALSAALMLGLAWLNDRLSRQSLENLQKEGRRASHYVESSMRNAEVLQALGMTHRLLARWRGLQNQIAGVQASANRTTATFTVGTKTVRQAIQILMLALGAWLVLSQQASGGIMIATSILLGKAVQPVEQLVGSWRVLAEARAAYGRLVELSREFERGEPRLSLPRPEGRLGAENVSFRLPGSDTQVLAGITFSLGAGRLSRSWARAPRASRRWRAC
jgi:ABC-type protease/lipase transport system fused ATPase/permease subunit